MIRLTKFNGKYDNDVHQLREMSWDHFVHFLAKREICAEKYGVNSDNPLFSPVEYFKGTDGFEFEKDWVSINNKTREHKLLGKWLKSASGEKRKTDMTGNLVRANVNVAMVYAAVIDYDGKPGVPPPSVEEIQEKVKAWNYAIYSTHNSTKASPRYRLMLPFEKPITADEFKRSWPWGFEGIDESCSDPARMFLMPTCPEATKAQAFFFSEKSKPFYQPVIPKISEKKKKKEAGKKTRGNYNTMNAEAWFNAHGMNPRQVEEYKFHVDCPWKEQHTGGVQGDTDTVLWNEPDKWPTFACSHATCKAADRTIITVMALWGDADQFCSEHLLPKDVGEKSGIIVDCMGHSEDGYYHYRCNATNHIVHLKPGQHKELELYGITSNPLYWWKYGDEDTGKVNWKLAARDLMDQCHRRGFFKPNAIRGGGMWMDEGRVVAHLGKTLLVDGVETDVFTFKSEYVYEAMVKEINLPPPLTAAEAKKVLELICRLPFANIGQSVLYAGMVFCGMICGILDWRSHLWLIGDPQSGKSTALKYTIAALWKHIGGVYGERGTTEAGLRQQGVRNNAYPVVVDECESDDLPGAMRTLGVVGFARGCSTESDAKTYKGTTTGAGMSFAAHSSCVLASVTENLPTLQDRERFTVIRMVSKPEAQGQVWVDLKKKIEETFTKEYSLGLYAFAIKNVQRYNSVYAVIRAAFFKNLPGVESRWVDQNGTLLAGAWIMLYESVPTVEIAWAWLSTLGLSLAEQSEEKEDASSAAERALAKLFAYQQVGMKPIGEYVESLLASTGFSEGAEIHLKNFGLKVRGQKLIVSSNHEALIEIFKNKGITGHFNLLSRIEGAERVKSERFGMHVSRAVAIPMKVEELRKMGMPSPGAPHQSTQEEDLQNLFGNDKGWDR